MILKEMSLKEKQIYIHSAVNTGISMEPVLDEIMREQDMELLEYAVGCMEEQGGESFASGRGRYELDKQQGKAPQELADALEALFEYSYDEVCMLELAVLYGMIGKESKAKQTLKKMIRLYEEGDFVDRARSMLECLTNQGAEPFLKEYRELLRPWKGRTEQNREPERHEQRGGPREPEKRTQPLKTVCELPPEIEQEFDHMVGMDTVKEKIFEFYKMNWLERMRLETLGLKPDEGRSCHFVLYGNPGTGKTTVARIIAKLLFHLGIRASDTLMEESRDTLVSAYIGQTEENVRKKLDGIKKQGGTLFIDEAYTLYRKNNEKDFGIEAVTTLLRDMENNRSSYSVIMAGYKKEMEEFLREANPGLRSRFNYHIVIPDYTTEELLLIAERLAKKKKYILSEEAKKAITICIERDRLDETFANARYIRDLMEEAQLRMAVRLSGKEKLETTDLMILKGCDFGIDGDRLSEYGIEELLKELNQMTGLRQAKEKVREIADSAMMQQEAERLGTSGSRTGTLHLIFKGSAGTGKTTVARILGKIYKQLGILKRGDVFVETRGEELAEGGAERVKALVQQALGGILFIDEAYVLAQAGNSGRVENALTALLADIDEKRDKLMVIAAGYGEQMDQFLAQNEGLRSRFPEDIYFEDYTPSELTEILLHMVEGMNCLFPDADRGLLQDMLKAEASQQDFGNARGVRNLVEKAARRRDGRLARDKAAGQFLTGEALRTFRMEDFAAERRNSDQESVDAVLEELNRMTGLREVKEKVEEMICNIVMNQENERLGVKNSGLGTLHMVFKGNAGTGKTTVARMIGRIYKQLGILRHGEVFVECMGRDLVGKYVGQSDKVVAEKVRSAMGGILFIDEAYSMCGKDDNDSFGRESLAKLLQLMENARDNLMVIVAGYEKEMDEFFQCNQGLESRFPEQIYFEDYTVEEMAEIFESMAQKDDMVLSEEAGQRLGAVLSEAALSSRDFGNARGVRNLYEKALRRKNMRLYRRKKAGLELTLEELQTIEAEDLQ